MRYFILGDVHLQESPYFEKRLTEISVINAKVKCKTLIQLGDLFHNYSITNKDLQLFTQFLSRLNTAGFKKYIVIQGNHEIPKHSSVPAISNILNDLMSAFGIDFTYITQPHQHENIFLIPYTTTTLPIIPESVVAVLSHVDTILFETAFLSLISLNGHNHTYKFHNDTKHDLGSIIPYEFDRAYTNNNYYAILAGDKLFVRPFKLQVKQKIVSVNSIDELKNVKRGKNEQVKIILNTKDITPSAVKNLIEDGQIDRVEFNTTSELSFNSDVQEIYDEILKHKKIIINNGIKASIVDSAEYQLKTLIGIKNVY